MKVVGSSCDSLTHELASQTEQNARADSERLSIAVQRVGERAARGVGEEGAHKDVGPPRRVADGLAAAQVLDGKAQLLVSVVGLEQHVVGVSAEELQVDRWMCEDLP